MAGSGLRTNRILSIEHEVKVWWDALGAYTRLQQDVGDARTWVDVRSSDANSALNWLMDTWPSLYTLSPGLTANDVRYVLKYALLFPDWPSALPHVASYCSSRAWWQERDANPEVWYTHWRHHGEPPDLLERVWAADSEHETRPVVGLCIVVPVGIGEDVREFRRIAEEARRRAIEFKEHNLDRFERASLPRGVKCDYADRVEKLLAWERAGRPHQRGRVVGKDTHSKSKLHQAETWLQRSHDDPFGLPPTEGPQH